MTQQTIYIIIQILTTTIIALCTGVILGSVIIMKQISKKEKRDE